MQIQYHYRGNSIYTDVFLKTRCAMCKPNCCGSNYALSPKGTCYLSICDAYDDFKDWHLWANWLPHREVGVSVFCQGHVLAVLWGKK